jgi:hypothetical protein
VHLQSSSDSSQSSSQTRTRILFSANDLVEVIISKAFSKLQGSQGNLHVPVYRGFEEEYMLKVKGKNSYLRAETRAFKYQYVRMNLRQDKVQQTTLFSTSF